MGRAEGKGMKREWKKSREGKTVRKKGIGRRDCEKAMGEMK